MSQRVEEIPAAESEPAAPMEYPHLRRNFFLGVFNGAMFSFAESLLSVDTVLTWFVQQLGGSNFLIGLVGPMRDAGWFLPQLFVSKWQERHSLKMPLYRKVTVVRTLAWFTWTVFMLTSKDLAFVLLVFFVAYAIYSLSGGISGLSFMDVVAKTIPIRRRGSYFGGRLFLGSLLGLGAGLIVGLMLNDTNPADFPANVGWISLIGWVAATLGLLAFSAVIEPHGDVRPESNTMVSHVRRAARLPRHNHNLRYFLIARVVLFLSYIAAPFYAIYSIDVLKAPAWILGLYVVVRTVASLTINPLWARLSDRRGNRLVMRAATAIGLAVPAWAIGAPLLAGGLHLSAEVTSFLFVPIFGLLGLYETGVGIGASNLLLEIAPIDDRAIYIGFTNTILGVAYFSTIVSGLLVDWLGYRGVFILALIFFAVAFWALSLVREPRELEKGAAA